MRKLQISPVTEFIQKYRIISKKCLTRFQKNDLKYQLREKKSFGKTTETMETMFCNI
jgi:hypothetical protein